MSKFFSYFVSTALWLASIYEVAMVIIRVVTGTSGSTPLLGGVLAPGSGPERMVALVLVGLFGWVLIDALLHLFRVWREQTNAAKLAASQQWEVRSLAKGTMAARRASLLANQPPGQQETLHEILPAAAALDASAIEGEFSHSHALIWALPVIGFIGTALGLAQSIGGFSDALKGDSSLLIQRLGQQVIPGLSGAFVITMAALAAATIGHFCITNLESWNSTVLSLLDDTTIRRLARIPRTPPQTAPRIGEQVEAAISRMLAVLQEMNANASTADKGLQNAASGLSTSAADLQRAAAVMTEATERPYQVTITRPVSTAGAAAGRGVR